MRLIVWNCAMALHEKAELLRSLRPDIAVVPECARPEILRRKAPSFHFDDCQWEGDVEHKGLGVFSFNGHRLARDSSWNAEYHLFLPISVSGPTTFNLLAVWAFNHRAPAKVSPNPRTTNDAVQHYAAFLSAGNSVMAGDFNGSVKWDGQTRYSSFGELDSMLNAIGRVSAYHAHHAVQLGAEPDATHFWQKNVAQPYHIDYAYVPREWLSHVNEIRVGRTSDWIGHSDHVPLILDIAVPSPT